MGEAKRRSGLVTPRADHKQFRDDLITLLGRYGDRLTSEEMLALSAHLVGQLIALQDQRTMTKERAMQIVGRNIEQGNQEVISSLENAPFGARQ
jgi:hypothetical protein